MTKKNPELIENLNEVGDDKKYLRIDVKKGERKYSLIIEDNSPIGECYDAVHEILLQILEYAKNAADKVASNNIKEDDGSKEQS